MQLSYRLYVSEQRMSSTRQRLKVAAACVALLLPALLLSQGQVASAGSQPPGAAAAAAAGARPNIVFITTDDMRVRDLQVMPNVRRLLTDQGMTFSASYAPFPLCCPARAAWVTGQYNHNNGVMGNQSPAHPGPAYSALDASNTVATWLRGAGYQTAFVGKYLNGYGLQKPVVVPPGWVEWHASVGGGNYFYTRLRENTGGVLATRTYDGPYQVDLYGDIATSIINRRVPAAAPLFLWVSQYAPHVGAPTEADDPAIATPAVPQRWKNFYASTPLPKDPNFNEADVSDKPAYVRNKRLLSATMQAQLKESNAQRWESLRAVDESVADIMNALQASGELANSVIVFTSDNGWMMGEHRIHAGKTVPYEESSRVPLVIRGPGFAANTSRPQPVANIDLAPTFADLADTTPGLAVDGRSLLLLATEPAAWPARTLVLEAGPKTIGGPDSYHGIRTPRYKYVRHSTGEVEFYDLIADPHEMTSLTNVPAHDSTQAQLESLLSKMENCAGATCR
jgi:arylsulfatase A-like enzyme